MFEREVRVALDCLIMLATGAALRGVALVHPDHTAAYRAGP
jgi:hypothetical protein